MDTSRAETASTLEGARQYVRPGKAVVPIPRSEKAPRIPGWPSLRIAEVLLAEHFSHGENIGLILGAASGGLVDIDFKPLASVPKCWCCGETYILDRLRESKGKTYA